MSLQRIEKYLKRSAAKNCRLLDDQEGNVSVVFAVSLVPVLMIAGMAVDYSRTVGADFRLQAAADGAALAAAAIPNAPTADRDTAIYNYFAANYPASEEGTASVTNIAYGTNSVTVDVQVLLDKSISSVISAGNMAATTTAVAFSDPGGPICMLSLSETASQAIYIHGNPEVLATGCNIQSNSNAPDALVSSGANAEMTADGICAPGGYSGSGFSPTPTTCSKAVDPYAGLVPPSTTGCDYSGLGQIKSSTTLSPGVICGGFIAKAAVTFQPGTYVIKDGEFSVAAKGSVTGDGVFFYFTGNNTGLDIKNDADLKAPSTGVYAGLLFAQDPASNPGNDTVIQGGGDIEFEGTFYLPSWHLDIGGNGTIAGLSPQVSLIADTIEVRGNGEMHVNADEVNSTLPEIQPRKTGVVRLAE